MTTLTPSGFTGKVSWVLPGASLPIAVIRPNGKQPRAPYFTFSFRRSRQQLEDKLSPSQLLTLGHFDPKLRRSYDVGKRKSRG